MRKLCLIYNMPSKYREAIYKTIDSIYDCDWYFGPTKDGIKEMDVSLLKNVKRYKVIGNTEKFFWNIGMLKLLFYKKYQAYFMIFENRSITAWLFFLLAFMFYRKKKFYIWTHGWYGKESGKEAAMKLWIYRHVTGIFCYGSHAKQLLIKQGISEDKLFVIHNSLDYDTQIYLRENIHQSSIYKEHFNNNYPTIIFIGRLTKVKKLDMIVNALSQLRDIGEKYNVVFVGDGAERESLKKLVKDSQIQEQVWFYGECYDEKINAELIYNADLCVSPGNVGLTSIHALTFGCPVITHDCLEWQMPEFEAIQEGLTGSFFKYNDVLELSKAISKWFKEKSDKRKEVREACFNEIDKNWNPYFQMEVIKKHLKF